MISCARIVAQKHVPVNKKNSEDGNLRSRNRCSSENLGIFNDKLDHHIHCDRILYRVCAVVLDKLVKVFIVVILCIIARALVVFLVAYGDLFNLCDLLDDRLVFYGIYGILICKVLKLINCRESCVIVKHRVEIRTVRICKSRDVVVVGVVPLIGSLVDLLLRNILHPAHAHEMLADLILE